MSEKWAMSPDELRREADAAMGRYNARMSTKIIALAAQLAALGDGPPEPNEVKVIALTPIPNDRERLWQAAVAAMAGIMADSGEGFVTGTPEVVAKGAMSYARALLAEFDKEKSDA